jgi:rhodanese-related sulfurtransferase
VKLLSLWWLPFGKVQEIRPHDLRRWLEEGRPVQILDARTGLEYSQGTIADYQGKSAGHAPVTEMPGSIERIPLDPKRPVVVLCLSGHRSRPGTRWLRARGYEAYSLKGGVGAWKLAGFPLQKPD